MMTVCLELWEKGNGCLLNLVTVLHVYPWCIMIIHKEMAPLISCG